MIRASIHSNAVLSAARLSLFAAAGCLSIAGCADESVPVDAERPHLAEAAITPLPPSTSLELGVMTGGYYSTGTDPYFQKAEQTMGDFRVLGARWIRMEANFGGNTSDEGMRRLVEKAHLRGLKVVMLLQGQACVPPVDTNQGRCLGSPFSGRDDVNADIDAFTASYINGPKGLNYYATQVFNTDLSRPDAYEILNEPNICVAGNPVCDAWQGRLGMRVGGNTAAWLLRRVKEWKDQNQRPELIISGGTLNTYTSETAYWGRFFGSGAWNAGPRPFDYFGIHPYDSNWLGADSGGCINGGGSGCFDQVMNGSSWVNHTASLISGLRQQIQALPGVGSSWGFFATEFGWAVNYGNCPVPNATGCVKNEAQQAEGLDASVRAMQLSGVAASMYNEYRDFLGGNYGLYGSDGSTWHTKPSYTKFRELAGASGPTDAWPTRYSDSTSPFEPFVEALSSSGTIEGCDRVSTGSFRPLSCFDPADRFSFGTNTSAKRGTVAAWAVRGANLAFDASGPAHFNDVPPNHPYYREIETAFRHGVLSGYSCGGPGEPCPGAYFRPNNDVTRAQTAKIIANAHGWPQVQNPTPTFNDVPFGSTFYGYVEACALRGLISGYSCGGVGEPCPGAYFRPGNSVTRGQLTKFVYYAATTMPEGTPGDPSVSDGSTGPCKPGKCPPADCETLGTCEAGMD